VLVDYVGLREISDCFVVDSKELVGQAFVKVDLPVFNLEIQTLIEYFDGGLVPPDQV